MADKRLALCAVAIAAMMARGAAIGARAAVPAGSMQALAELDYKAALKAIESWITSQPKRRT
jgi:hypothetical protein